MSGYWQEVGGQCGDRWEGVIDVECPECHAPVKAKCVNPLSNTEKHLPCWKRQRMVTA